MPEIIKSLCLVAQTTFLRSMKNCFEANTWLLSMEYLLTVTVYQNAIMHAGIKIN